MRYVSYIPPVTTPPVTREVKRLSAARGVKPVYPPEEPGAYVEAVHAVHPDERREERQLPRAVPFEDRRKVCRRVSHQPVLVELRSGVERRHHNLREGDIVEHIDETA